MSNDTPEECAVLIIDDEASLRNTFRIFLERAGYRPIVTAATFEEAVQAVATRMFDLIICDIVLENFSGIDLFKRFRQLGVACPVVIVTGYPHVETASEAVRLGAFDYLAKPVEKETLLKTARLATAHYRLEKENIRADFARRQYRQFLETIFKSVSDAIISVDRHMTVMKTNQAANQLLQTLLPDFQEGANLAVLCQHKDLCRLTMDVETVLLNNSEQSDIRLECYFAGDCKVLSCCISPLEGGKNEVAGAVLVIRDITQKEHTLQESRNRFHNMIGSSMAMQNIYRMIENIGKSDASVLITGESGTGKELAVQALHLESKRHDRPLVTVDCTAVPENLFESELFGHKRGSFTGANTDRQGRVLQAEGGTLFLDEIGNIPMTIQLRLLRFLQEKTFYPVGRDTEVRVDVRVVAATNVDLKEKVQNGSFREDLYYRLLIIDIHLPPLRERKGDIIILSNHFLRLFAEKMAKCITGISEQAQSILCHYSWPGNVRQLLHVIERACILCQDTTISTEHLPEEMLEDTPVNQISTPDSKAAPTILGNQQPTIKLPPSLSEEEQQLAETLVDALKKAGGNKAKAARLLGIDRSTLYRKLHELHLDIDMFTF